MSSVLVSTRPWRGFLLVTVVYLAALLAAALTLRALPGTHPLLALLAADAVATLVVFIGSRLLDNSSVYDAYWSVAPMAAAAWLAAVPGAALGWSGRQLLVVALVQLWGARLTFNWARGWVGVRHEDWRYVMQREKFPRAYWLISLVGLHFMPTLMVFLGMLPLDAVLVRSAEPLGFVDALATIVTLAAIAIETIGDEQLRSFRRTAKPGSVCDVGLWSVSRHPNYLGEIGFWLGLALFGSAAGAPWWSWSGVAAMILLFTTISIPLAEGRSASRRLEWRDYARRTAMLVPWLRFRRD